MQKTPKSSLLTIYLYDGQRHPPYPSKNISLWVLSCLWTLNIMHAFPIMCWIFTVCYFPATRMLHLSNFPYNLGRWWVMHLRSLPIRRIIFQLGSVSDTPQKEAKETVCFVLWQLINGAFEGSQEKLNFMVRMRKRDPAREEQPSPIPRARALMINVCL